MGKLSVFLRNIFTVMIFAKQQLKILILVTTSICVILVIVYVLVYVLYMYNNTYVTTPIPMGYLDSLKIVNFSKNILLNQIDP